MYRWLEQYQNEITHTTSISDLMLDVEIDEPIEFADKQSLPVDQIVYQKVCLHTAIKADQIYVPRLDLSSNTRFTCSVHI